MDDDEHRQIQITQVSSMVEFPVSCSMDLQKQDKVSGGTCVSAGWRGPGSVYLYWAYVHVCVRTMLALLYTLAMAHWRVSAGLGRNTS